MKKKLLLLDDDPSMNNFVIECLEELTVDIYFVQSVNEALDLLKKQEFDAAILDVHINYQESGLKVAEYLDKQNKIPFLFLTAHSDDMMTGMLKNYNAHCHLIKPVNPRQLLLEVKSMLTSGVKPKSGGSRDEFLTIRVKGDRIVIRKDDIIYVEAEGNYSRIITYKSKYSVSKTLKVLSRWLTEDVFIRTSRSYIVNISAISKMSTDKVELVNGHVLPISRNQYKTVMTHFINF